MKLKCTNCFICLIILVLLFIEKTGFTQINVTGRVVNEDEEPIIGANVIVKGSAEGTITNEDGIFLLENLKSGSILSISFLGYITEEIVIDRSVVLKVVLQQDWAKLDEVVVIGYGTLKKSDLTGAISSIRQEDIVEVKSSNAIESMQGKAAGVDMIRDDGRTGAGYDVRIRGTRSLNADNQPLYILDGVEYGSNIDINPNDIESIEILKDASSSAIYGVRGANGVVLITSKKGEQGRARISFNAYTGYTKPLGELPIGDREYYLGVYENLAKTYYFENMDPGHWKDTIQPSTYTNLTTPPINDFLKSHEATLLDKGYDFNWYDNLIKDGGIQDYHIAVTGGTEDITYSSSINYFKEDGFIDEDVFNRLTGRINLEVKINNILSIGGSSMLSHRIHQKTNDPSGDAMKLSPLVPSKDSLGNYFVRPSEPEDVLNPFLSLELNERQQRTTRAFNSYYVNFSFFDCIKVRSNFSLDFIFDREGSYSRTIPEMSSLNSAWLQESNSIGWVSTNTVEYIKQKKDHNFQATGVFEARLDRIETMRQSGSNLTLDDNLWYSLNTSSQDMSVDLLQGDYFSKHTMASFLGRVHYNYKGKYFLTGTGRYDGASLFAKGHKWSFFPSASVAWRISEEEFFNIRPISNLKIRIGYGAVGNQAIEAYSTLGGVNSTPLYYEFGITEVQALGYRPTNVEAKLLSWETTIASNFGLDFGFYKNRIYGSVDLYRSQTKDLLLQRTLVPSNAITSVYDNVGRTENNGIELHLSSTIINTRKLTYSTDFTFAANKERIVSLVTGVKEDLANQWFVDYPVRVFYNYEFEGVWQLNEAEEARLYGREPGDVKLRDIYPDSAYSASDYTILGHKNPDWTAGWTHRLIYKRFDFTVFLQARIGQTIFDEVLDWWSPQGRENSMKLNYWTPDNPSNEYPGVNYYRQRSGWSENNPIAYVDGSYMKIKDIALGYTVDEQKLQRLHIAYFRVYVSAKNAFAFGNYFRQGRFDPELEGDISWPMPSIYSIGFKMEL
ncbi:MAG: TonB-dependent receptor [Bacteroidales bacterium]|nr:TonB-dependent receptor [Bacteroidales bacterium]